MHSKNIDIHTDQVKQERAAEEFIDGFQCSALLPTQLQQHFAGVEKREAVGNCDLVPNHRRYLQLSALAVRL
jgi:hypothetical protein